MIRTTVSGVEDIQKQLADILTEFDVPTVTVGIHEDAADPEGGITMAGLGATHEFGANIQHPGGTTYGYASEADAEAGRVRFLEAGAGFMVLGQTGPHAINIPARPWLGPGFESGLEAYQAVIEKAIADGSDIESALKQVGVMAVGFVQEYMTNLSSPPNAPSTIQRKGSANPLIDSGAMRASVSFKMTPVEPEEGL